MYDKVLEMLKAEITIGCKHIAQHRDDSHISHISLIADVLSNLEIFWRGVSSTLFAMGATTLDISLIGDDAIEYCRTELDKIGTLNCGFNWSSMVRQALS